MMGGRGLRRMVVLFLDWDFVGFCVDFDGVKFDFVSLCKSF